MIIKITTAAVLAILLAAMSGCTSALAVADYKTVGPTQPAEYKPNPKAPMLIMVENYGGIGQLNQDATYLNAALTKQMTDNKIAPLIQSSAVDGLRDSRKDTFGMMRVSDIATAVGAKQVLYVNVLRADLEIPSGEATASGLMEVRVRLIDGATGNVLWPDNADGYPLQVNTPIVQRDTDKVDMQIHHDMADRMGESVCNLFHDWKSKYENQEKNEASGMSADAR